LGVRVVRAPGSHAEKRDHPEAVVGHIAHLNLVEQTDELLDVASSNVGDDKPGLLNSR
jgi:hypothetical protein